MEDIGIYVHIPFCMKKCNYCDFVSYAGKQEKINNYIEAVKQEIQFVSKEEKQGQVFSQKQEEIGIKEQKRKVSTIYIGGGTPSYIETKYITQILQTIRENFDVMKEAEITIEVNPGTVTTEKIKDYQAAGINRISIGLQAVQDTLLKEIGRIHTYNQFLQTYADIKKVGIANQNIDLMIGLPGQTIQQVEETISNILTLKPKHISVYSLIVEEGTILEKQLGTGLFCLPDEEVERAMYWKVKQMLEAKGYEHYEISNFAKKGYASKHNCHCWEQKEYIGFGVAAHSYLNQKRYSNITDIDAYIENVQTGRIQRNKQIHEIQNKEDEQKEYMLLGLRKIEGVSIQNFKCKFGENPIFLYRQELDKLVKKELVEVDTNQIKLTNRGIDLANLVWEEFI